MKKIAALLLALILVFSLTSCGRSVQQPEPTPTPDIAEPTPEPTPTPDIAEPTPEPTPAVPADENEETCSYMELEGVWLQTGYEIEGDIGQTMPIDFNSLVFKAEGTGETKILLASSEEWYIDGFDDYGSYYDRSVTLLDESLYEGCGNEVWSVRVGGEAPRSEAGYPLETEYYVTLIDRNTLLQQRYFSYDEGTIPMVSYQTYKRFLPEASDIGAETLAGSDFELAGYIDAEGVRHDNHPDYSDFRLHLDISGGYRFAFTADGAEEYNGGGNYWAVGCGGTILLRNEDFEEDCFAGAAACQSGVPEILLWDNAGGILCLKHMENGDERWFGYVDTMNAIEGNTFAAPANALCVLYNQNYADFGELYSVPFYEVSGSADAQYVLVTAVEDGSYFWLQDQEGYCAEDFGTLDAGDSILVRLDIPESGGLILQISTSLGDYCYELTRDSLTMVDNWGYITT